MARLFLTRRDGPVGRPEPPRARVWALVTGSEPFHRWRVNASWEGVFRLARRRPDLAARLLPVDHAQAAAALRAAIEALRPRAVLLCGLADDRLCRLERRARSRGGDGPADRLGAWPWSRAEAAMRRAGAPVRPSTDAGLYVCESAYRAALDQRAEARRAGRGAPDWAAFLHVPPIGPRWPAERTALAIEAALAPIDPTRAGRQRRRGTRGTR